MSNEEKIKYTVSRGTAFYEMNQEMVTIPIEISFHLNTELLEDTPVAEMVVLEELRRHFDLMMEKQKGAERTSGPTKTQFRSYPDFTALR